MKNIHKILKPTYYYLIIVILFYYFRDIQHFSLFVMNLLIAVLVILIFPLILLFLDVKLMNEINTHFKTLKLFLLCFVPGLLFGLQMSYGFYAMGHGDDLIKVIIPFAVIGLFCGLISGLVGLFLNFVLNKIKLHRHHS